MLEVISGSMWAGKSGVLIDRMLRANIAGKSTIVFKPETDDRYSTTEVVSHDGFRVGATLVLNSSGLLHAWESAGRPKVVGVDEAQFFPLTIVNALDWLADQGVRVIVAGLSMDFLNQPFPVMRELLARADRVDKLVAVCHTCREETATRSQLVRDGKAVTKADTNEIVGGSDLYEARCRGCFEYEGKHDDRPQEGRAHEG